jgi:predicted RNA-binding Zn-ribbon protein involved in translation (DUF1610 family)
MRTIEERCADARALLRHHGLGRSVDDMPWVVDAVEEALLRGDSARDDLKIAREEAMALRAEMLSLRAAQGDHAREITALAAASKPVPMRLPCPRCHELHVDTGDFATKLHHTHACQHCGEVWRPALVNTVGVQFLPGFRDERTYTASEIRYGKITVTADEMRTSGMAAPSFRKPASTLEDYPRPAAPLAELAEAHASKRGTKYEVSTTLNYHNMRAIQLQMTGIHTGRPTYLVICLSCRELVHESTTSYKHHFESHSMEPTP